jgi:hypothetical protein
MPTMNMKLISGFLGLALVCGGCVRTGSDSRTVAVPFVKDSVEGKYERTVAQVHDAAKAVLQDNGSVTKDSSLLTSSNTVYAVEGKVNQRNVWIRVEALEPRLTLVRVQARNKFGGRDLELVHDLEKQIAIKLTR